MCGEIFGSAGKDGCGVTKREQSADDEAEKFDRNAEIGWIVGGNMDGIDIVRDELCK